MVLAAGFQATRNIGIAIAVILSLAWLIRVLINLREAKPEVGSEIDLAPNRSPGYTDEQLEGPRLTRSLLAGVAMLVIIGVGLPLYWIAEPGRMEGAISGYDAKFARRGLGLYESFGCNGCHGADGVGGVAAYTFSDPRTGEVKSVAWKAPALNTVLLRYSEDEVRYILTFGRPFSPMSPWGTDGGGPMNEQQLQNLIDYLRSIQLCDPAVAGVCEKAQGEVLAGLEDARAANPGATDGELLFSLDVGTTGGAYGCARCHTRGWSYGEPQVSGGGALGPNLTGGSTARQFPVAADHEKFIADGSEDGRKYGSQGQGSGKMPGFGSLLTPEQIQAIVEYERSL